MAALDEYMALLREEGEDVGPQLGRGPLWPQAPAPAPVSQAPTGPSWLSGFLQSAGYSFGPELIGLEAPQHIKDWRDENWWSGLGSQILGAAVPYGLGMRAGSAAIRALPKIIPGSTTAKNLLAGTSALAREHPIAAAGARTALELLPFEIGRMGVSQALPGEGLFGLERKPTSEVAASAVVDLLGGAVLSSSIKGVKSLLPSMDAAVRDVDLELQKFIPNYNPSASPQDRLKVVNQHLSALKATGEEVTGLDFLDAARTRALLQVRTMGAPSELVDGERIKGKYVRGLVGGIGEEAKEVNRLFAGSGEGNLVRRKFQQSVQGGFEDRTKWVEALNRVGLPDDWAEYVAYPRHLSFKNEKASQEIQKKISSTLQPVHEGWFLREETDTGLYVMAKKTVGSPTVAAMGDEWTIFKTSEPNKILKKDLISLALDRTVNFATRVQETVDQKVMAELAKQEPESIIGTHVRFKESIPKQKFIQEISKIEDPTERALALLPKEMQQSLKDGGEQAAEVWKYVKGYVAPAAAQFRKTPGAEWVRLTAQNIFDTVRAKADLLSYGDQGLKEGQSVFGKIFSNKVQRGGVEKAVIEGLKDEDMGLVTGFLEKRLDTKKIFELTRELDEGQRTRIRNFFDFAKGADDVRIADRLSVERLVGIEDFKPLENHYGVPHTWIGDHRVPVRDVNGNLRAVGTGRTRDAAIEDAKIWQKQLGVPTQLGKPIYRDGDWDAAHADKLFNQQRFPGNPRLEKLGTEPLTDALRQEILGYVGSRNPMTRRELADVMQKNIGRQYQYVGEVLTKHDLGAEVLDVGRTYGGEVMNQLVYRLNKMAGYKGTIDKAVNNASQKLLGNVLGQNAADKLVRAYSEVEYTLSLLAGNMGFAAMTALAPIQTLLPKLALMRNTTPDGLLEHLGFIPAIENGKTKGLTAFFEPLLIMRQAQKWMGKGMPEEIRGDVNRAAKEGVFTPKWKEEFLGQSSVSPMNTQFWREAGSSKNPVLESIKRISDWLPTRLEELTRSHAFLSGEFLARKVMGIKDPEQVYQFSKQMALRSMYAYSGADKAKIMNGPLGGIYGLFKNWMFNNMADWGQYVGEGFTRRNFAPLAWAAAGTGALGGVAGLPLYGAVDGLQKLGTGKNLMQQLYESFGQDGKLYSDMVYFGLPALLGVSLQGQAAGPLSDPARDLTWLGNAMLLNRGEKIHKFLNESLSHWYGGGGNPFENDRTWDLAAYAFGPRTLYKAMAQVEGGALKSIKEGQPILEGVTPGEYWLNVFGLTPTKIARAFELQEDAWKEKRSIMAKTSLYGQALAQAIATDNSEGQNRIYARAMLDGVDLQNVMKSASVRLRRQEMTLLDTDFKRLGDVQEQRILYGLL